MASRRTAVVALGASAILSIAIAAGALAGNGRFLSSTASLVPLGASALLASTSSATPAPSSGFAPQIQFDWVEKGAGSKVHYGLGATTLVVDWACYNLGANHPKAVNKSIVPYAVPTATVDLPAGQNGTITGSYRWPAAGPIDLGGLPTPTGFSCPNSNYTIVATFDHYEGVFLYDATNDVYAFQGLTLP
jgi:hypothetical protein